MTWTIVMKDGKVYPGYIVFNTSLDGALAEVNMFLRERGEAENFSHLEEIGKPTSLAAYLA